MKFLSPQIEQWRDATAMAFLQQMRHHPISLSGSHSIATAYTQQGQGTPPIVLLHGFDSSLLEFRHLLLLLAPQYQTWAVDWFGFGFTERISELPVNPALVRLFKEFALKGMLDRSPQFHRMRCGRR